MSGGAVDLLQVPFEVFAVGTVDLMVWRRDRIARPSVQLLPVLELLAQPKADQQPMVRIDSEIAAVIQGMDVRAQEQTVVRAVLPADRQRPNVGCLQDASYALSCDGAAGVACLEYDRLKGLLTESLGRQSRGSVDGTGAMPRLAEVDFYDDAQ